MAGLMMALLSGNLVTGYMPFEEGLNGPAVYNFHKEWLMPNYQLGSSFKASFNNHELLSEIHQFLPHKSDQIKASYR
jgi:hypothetical protein